MAAIDNDPKQKKQRNKNFSVEEENVIHSMVEANLDIINSKFSNEVSNRSKADVWKKITDSVNLIGVALRSVNQVKEKWGNMTQKAKKCYTSHRKQRQMTGGGPPPAEMGSVTDKIIDLMKDTASFNGVPGGIDSIIIPVQNVEDSNSCFNRTIPTDNSVTPANTYSVPIIDVEIVPGISNIPEEDQSDIAGMPESSASSVPAVFSVTDASYSEGNRSSTKRKRKCRPTQDDVLEKQCEVLEGQLKQQELEKEKTKLETQKMRLQIKLLEKMIMKQDEIDMGTINPTELLLSLMN